MSSDTEQVKNQEVEVPSFSQKIGTYEETEVIKFAPTKVNTDELLLSFKRSVPPISSAITTFADLSLLQSLQLNGEYTDFSIKCGDDMYKVHKAIICPRSAFFRAVFANDTKVLLLW